MENPELKPSLSLGFQLQMQGGGMPQGTSQQQLSAGESNSPSDNSSLHDSMHVSSALSDTGAENLLAVSMASQGTLQLMGQEEMGVQAAARGVFQHLRHGVASAGEFAAVGNGQPGKRRGSPLQGRPRGGLCLIDLRRVSLLKTWRLAVLAQRHLAVSKALVIRAQLNAPSQSLFLERMALFIPLSPPNNFILYLDPCQIIRQASDRLEARTTQLTSITTLQSGKQLYVSGGNKPLAEVDPDLWDIMEKEKQRQWRGIELIASENFTSLAVFEALGSHLTNKYSEGLPGSRYYKGNQYIDQIESLCCSRALAAFHLDPEKWGVNVQPYSCSTANFAVYTALLQPQDRIMGLDVLSGGHVSHGYHTHSGKKISAASIYFQSLPFKVHPESGLIDYEKLEETALLYRPKILICGGSSYPREWDYARFRQIADKVNAILMCDMAHISGIILAQECKSPFGYCDIVTSTTHKSLRGPRGGMIFYRKGLKAQSRPSDGCYSFEKDISFAIHPSLQGGPHNNHIAGLAAALKQAVSPEYKAYIQQVKRNAQALVEGLKKRGCKLVTDGTDNHLMLWDLRPFGVTGNLFEEVCEACQITVNKNAVYGDSSSWQPGGVRIGTPAMTTRGCNEVDFDLIAGFLHKAVQIAMVIQKETAKLQREFVKGLLNNADILELRAKVEKFASSLEMPGFEVSGMKFYNA